MVSLDWQLTDADGVTLVQLLLTGDTDLRVEVESNLRPVWPPRQQGRPAAGWTETGFEGVVAADERLVLGYASPADPTEPPARVVETEPVAGDLTDDRPEPRDLVRSLGAAGPPRDAVPLPDEDTERAGEAGRPGSPGRAGEATTPQAGSDGQGGNRSVTVSGVDGMPSRNGHGSDGSGQADVSRVEQQRDPTGDRSTDGSRGSGKGSYAADRSPGEAVEAWLGAVERRVETAERLATAETVPEARAAVRAAGGIGAVRALCADLEADRRRFEALETGEGQLGERLADVEIPLSTLERLA